MQVIREPEQLDVVLRVIEVEDVLVVDQDLSDHGAGSFQLSLGRNARRLPGGAIGGRTNRESVDPGGDALGGGALRARERHGVCVCVSFACGV